MKYDIWNLGKQKYVLKKIENAADNNYINSETLTESLFNDLTDCPLPIDNIIDLNTLEDKISGDKCFRNKLVIKYLLMIIDNVLNNFKLN